MTDLVSVITPAYNAQAYLEEAILSVIVQSYENWEMIIVDDASGDRTAEIAEMYARKEARIRVIKLTENSGAAIARNRAIEAAKGRYIAFLDADDCWLPHKLETQITFMHSHALAFTYSAYVLIDEKGETQGEFIPKAEICYDDLLKTCDIGCLTAIYDTKAVGKVTMPLLRRRQDYAAWLHIFRKIGCSKGVLEPLARYRLRGDSISSNKIKAAYYQWRVYREVERLSLFRSAYSFAWYVYYGLRKYKKEHTL